MKKASIIVTTRNQEYIIKETINALLNQDYPKKNYEIIVMNDGSTDRTKEILDSYGEKIIAVHLPQQGAVINKNIGFKKAKNRYAVLLGADCVPDRKWLRTLLEQFTNDKIGFVSAFDVIGGTSTAYDKKVLKKVGLNDLRFNEKGSGFRDDSDLAYRIWDADYTSVFNYKAKFKHEHSIKPGIGNALRYAWSRIKIHKFDALLYKKHPKRTTESFDVKFGFLVNPVRDFEAATGTWGKRFGLKKEFALSSPQGIKLIQAKTPLHVLAILFVGLVYVFLVKLARLYGSIKYGTLLL